MKLTYKQRIFSYFLIIFVLFTASIIIVEQKEEKKYKTDDLIARLDRYSDFISIYIEQNKLNNPNSIQELRTLTNALPEQIRVTVLNPDGKVTFDRDIKDLKELDNHLDRPEIRSAQYQNTGTNIRLSASTQQEYIYYAKHYPNYYVRVALPYNVETKGMLKADNMFIYVVLILFAVVLILLSYASTRFSTSIKQLRGFTSRIKDGQPLPKDIDFPDDELGEIGNEVVEIFNQKEKIKQNINAEREKLIRHFQYSEEGLCVFSPTRQKVYANTHFIQYLNLITDKPVFDANMIFEESAFLPLSEYLDDDKKAKNHFVFQIKKSGKTFLIKSIVFNDKNFEITIRDITEIEKNRLLKQEMTSNIAHELRTPITSLRAYLETLQNRDLSADQQTQFIEKAHQQAIRLSVLIDDISLISKIEEGSGQFVKEKVNLSQLIDEVRIGLSDKLSKNSIKLNLTLRDDVVLNGNRTLLYSIFSNLIDNSINYGGQGVEIHIDNYTEDERYIYISFYDTGSGVDEKHLNRLFERFYRVSEGRTRNTGGSGLGLSIVKNAILFHKGEIQVKNRTGGGLEFLFTLKK